MYAVFLSKIGRESLVVPFEAQKAGDRCKEQKETEKGENAVEQSVREGGCEEQSELFEDVKGQLLNITLED